MRGLAYLEWCYARNNFRAIWRSPVRLVLWILYAATLAFWSFTRFSHVRPQQPTLGVTHGAALGIAGVFLVATGGAILLGRAGRFAAFRSRAEAVLMVNAGLHPRTIAIWLQLRKSAGGLRSLGAFSYTFLAFAPVHAGALGTLRAFVATLIVLAIPQTAALPAFLLARGRGRVAVIVAGTLLTGLGILYGLAGLSGVHVFAPLLRATHVDLALLVKAALLAEPVAFVLPLLLLAAFVAVVALRGGDVIPELYAASGTLPERQRLGQGRARRIRRGDAAASVRVPAGSLALVWKHWIALRRAPGGIRVRAAGPLFWTACGVGAAYLTLHFNDETPVGAYWSIIGLRIMFWTPYSAAGGLAAELAQPLFWLSTDSFRTRLVAWTLAGAWPSIIALGCGGAAAALVLGRPLVAIASVPLAALATLAFKALGIGFYTLFPDPLDAGGPTLLLRLAASAAYLIPAALVATVAGVLHAGPFGITAVFALALGAQGWIVLELVALRFAEYGASLATLSRAT